MKWLIYLIITLSLGSCVSTYPTMNYSTSQNVPLFENRNEVRLSAATGSQYYGFQGAYACTNLLALMGSYSNGLISDGGNRNSREFAIGYYKYKPKDSSTFEIYGGVERYYRDFTVWTDALAGSLPSDSFRTNATKFFI